jgi:hypothetical protein
MDFSKCLYDPFDKKLLEKILSNKSLAEEFGASWGDADRIKENTCRFIVLMYDPDSPMIIEFKDFWQRKMECALLAGFKLNKLGELDKDVEDVLTAENTAAYYAITKYMVLSGGMAHMTLWAYITQLAYIQKKFLSGKADKNDLADSIKLRGEIKKLTDEVYGGADEVEKGRKMLYIQLASRQAFRPENFVKRMEEGDSLIDGSPYGEDYEVSQSTFIGDEAPKNK